MTKTREENLQILIDCLARQAVEDYLSGREPLPEPPPKRKRKSKHQLRVVTVGTPDPAQAAAVLPLLGLSKRKPTR